MDVYRVQCDWFFFFHFKKSLSNTKFYIILGITLKLSFIFIVISDLSLRAHYNASTKTVPRQHLAKISFHD